MGDRDVYKGGSVAQSIHRAGHDAEDFRLDNENYQTPRQGQDNRDNREADSSHLSGNDFWENWHFWRKCHEQKFKQ